MTDAADGLPLPRRYGAIFTIVLAVIVTVLDGAIANVALPTIAADLKVSASASIWVVNAYQIAIITTLLPFASLGDSYGYRRVYGAGLVIFTAASLICATADTLPMLALGRVLQGAGAAGVFAVNTALLRFIYPRAWFGRAIGINAFVISTASATGPTVAAAILSVASWQWLFAINLPIGVIALLMLPSLPRTTGSGHRLDYFGAVLNALAFGLFITGIGSIAESAARAAIEAFLGIAIGAVLVVRQLARPFPLLPIDLLRLPRFAYAAATSCCSFIAYMAAYVALPFHLVTVLGRTPVETGLLMTPWPLVGGIVSPLSGWLSERHSTAILCALGLGLFALGLGLLAALPDHPSDIDIVWRMALTGGGFALFQAPNNRAMIIAAPRERSGSASGMLGTARTLGLTTGASLTALLLHFLPKSGTTATLAASAAIALAAAGISSLRRAAGPD